MLNLELRRPIGFSQFEAAVFVDAGSLGADASDWEELSDLRYGIGAGLRYLSRRVGPGTDPPSPGIFASFAISLPCHTTLPFS